MAGYVVVVTYVAHLVGLSVSVRLTLGAVVLVVCVELAQHFVVRRPQRVDDVGALALDDTLRSGAAHALAGGATTHRPRRPRRLGAGQP